MLRKFVDTQKFGPDDNSGLWQLEAPFHVRPRIDTRPSQKDQLHICNLFDPNAVHITNI